MGLLHPSWPIRQPVGWQGRPSIAMDWLLPIRRIFHDLMFRHEYRLEVNAQERVTIEPSVAVFNIFNFSNFNLPPFTMSGLLTGSAGSVNGTHTQLQSDCGCVPNDTFRVGNGTGTYAQGAGRQIEWGLKNFLFGSLGLLKATSFSVAFFIATAESVVSRGSKISAKRGM